MMTVEPVRIDDLTRSYFATANTNHDDRISFDEFVTLTARYPALLAEARWIAPNEDLLARLERRIAPEHRLTNHRRELVVLAIWIAAQLAMLGAAFAGSHGTATIDSA
ncbi:MAG: EF-hand domain-containing protein [Kofleriaceae bacterium]